MKTILILCVTALVLAAASPAQAFEPNWGEEIHVFIEDNEMNSFMWTAWSPDGSTLAFGLEAGLWLVDADGGVASHICYLEDLLGWYFDLSFTPDGTEVTFAYITSETILSSNLTIASVNVTTGAYREITTGWLPVWSPSGRYLLCEKYSDSDDSRGEMLVIRDTDTGDETTLVEIPWKPGYLYKHSFLPDESAVVFSTNYSFESGEPDDIFSLYRIPINGGEPEKIVITDADGEPYSCKLPIVHPDGIHAVVKGEGSTIALVNMETGTVRPLTPVDDDKYGASFVGLSPDGMRISFVYQSKDPHPAGNELHIIDLDESLFDGAEGPTMVEADSPASFPTLASYPNPFNPTTTISFTLPAGGFTELAVYNLAGQKIRTLVAGEFSAGVHEVVWDGRDDAGNPVSSGIFVSRLKTGDRVVTNRMMLVK